MKSLGTRLILLVALLVAGSLVSSSAFIYLKSMSRIESILNEKAIFDGEKTMPSEAAGAVKQIVNHNGSPSVKPNQTISSNEQKIQQIQDEFLQSILMSLIASVFFALIVAMMIASSISKPISALAKAAEKMGLGNRKARVNLTPRSDEIGILTESFNQMANNLEESYQRLENYSKNLEGKIEETGEELLKEKYHVNSILDSITEGLLVIDRKLTIKEGFSKSSLNILAQKEVLNRPIMSVLFPDLKKTKEQPKYDKLEDCLVTAFNLVVARQFHDIMDYAPKHIQYHREVDGITKFITLSLSYAPMLENDSIDHIVVTFTDITDVNVDVMTDGGNHAHGQVIEALDNIQTLLTDPHDREAVGSSLSEIVPMAMESLKDIEAINHSDLNALFRKLHTIKGAVRSHNFDFLNYFAHEAETTAADLRDNKTKLEDIDIGELYRKGLSLVNGLEHLHQIWTGAPKANEPKKHQSSSFPWDSYISSLNKSVSALSSELGKQVHLDVFADEGLTGEDLIVLKHALIHLIHNSIDHGIEVSDQRLKSGKSEYGQLTLEVNSFDDSWQVTFRDDGGGINADKVLEVATDRKLEPFDPKTITNKDLMDILCHPGFSSKEVATDVSGRGVGMDAVRHNLRNVGGDIELVETSETGTIYELKWPQKSEIVQVDNFVPGEGILVVDDEPEMRSLISLSLEEFDLPVFEAESREAANEIMTLRSIGVIITDISMNGGSGLTLISDISQEHHHVPVIVITGSLSQPTGEQMLAMGIAAWLTKPCPHDQLLSAVNKALRQRKISAETELLANY